MTEEDKKKLKDFVDRGARLESEKKGLADDYKEVADACRDATGVSVKTFKKLVKDALSTDLEKQARQIDQDEYENCIHALGTLGDTPLGEFAKERSKPRKHKETYASI